MHSHMHTCLFLMPALLTGAYLNTIVYYFSLVIQLQCCIVDKSILCILNIHHIINLIFQEKMVLKESTIPDLLSEPVNIKWEEGAPLPFATAAHTAVLFNEAIYVGGGGCDNEDNKFRINIYHPDTNKWDDAIDTSHVYFAMTVLVDKLIIVGGLSRVTDEVTNKLLVLEHGQWKDYTQMPTARMLLSVVSHQSLMIVIGGMNTEHRKLRTTELLDSTTGQWFICDDLPQPLAFLESVIVGDILYILSGAGYDGNDSKAVYAAPLDALSSHQLKWQQLADIPWLASAAVSLNNKYLLAVGGNAVHDTVCVLKRGKTSTSWESIGSLPTIRYGTSAVSLANQIIVIGGMDDKKCRHKTVTIGTFQ